jgi:serine protease inhibitor
LKKHKLFYFIFKGKKLGELEKQVTFIDLKKLFSYSPKDVAVTLPKFKIEFQ